MGISGGSSSPIEGIVRQGMLHWMEFVIPIADYHMFWDDMANQGNATMFATKMLTRLVELLDSPAQSKTRLAKCSKVSAADDIEHLHNTYTIAICHTLHFLKICFNIDTGNRDFQAALESLSQPKYRMHGVQDVIADVHSVLKQDAQDVAAAVRKVVMDCSWFGRTELASTAMEHFDLNCCKSFAFDWLYLKLLVSSGKCVAMCIKQIVTLLTSLAKMLPSLLAMPEEFDSTLKSLVALQFMLVEVVSCHPIMDTSYLLHDAIPALRPYCLWASPIGEVRLRCFRSNHSPCYSCFGV